MTHRLVIIILIITTIDDGEIYHIFFLSIEVFTRLLTDSTVVIVYYLSFKDLSTLVNILVYCFYLAGIKYIKWSPHC